MRCRRWVGNERCCSEVRQVSYRFNGGCTGEEDERVPQPDERISGQPSQPFPPSIFTRQSGTLLFSPRSFLVEKAKQPGGVASRLRCVELFAVRCLPSHLFRILEAVLQTRRPEIACLTVSGNTKRTIEGTTQSKKEKSCLRHPVFGVCDLLWRVRSETATAANPQRQNTRPAISARAWKWLVRSRRAARTTHNYLTSQPWCPEVDF